jgi:hypothetical protein
MWTPLGCSSNAQPSPTEVLSSQFTAVTVQIAYVAGAEPYTDSFPVFGDLFRITRVNLARLFVGTNHTLTVPSSLDQMQRIDSPGRTSYVDEDILVVASKHRPLAPPKTATYYVVFLDGIYGPDPTSIGATVHDTGVIAMFKPVLQKSFETHTAMPTADQTWYPRFIEQLMLSHELGHAVGLVNRGIPMRMTHEDQSHPNHCTNASCLMYWSPDALGNGPMRQAPTQPVADDALMFFGPECLADMSDAVRRAQ